MNMLKSNFTWRGIIVRERRIYIQLGQHTVLLHSIPAVVNSFYYVGFVNTGMHKWSTARHFKLNDRVASIHSLRIRRNLFRTYPCSTGFNSMLAVRRVRRGNPLFSKFLKTYLHGGFRRFAQWWGMDIGRPSITVSRSTYSSCMFIVGITFFLCTSMNYWGTDPISFSGRDVLIHFSAIHIFSTICFQQVTHSPTVRQ